MPEPGRYLSVLEKQIDRLIDKLIEADLVELKLKLLPSGLRLVIIARVVLIETDSNLGQGEHKISLDFEHLHEADREILIKHIHGKQMEALSSAQES